jgi:hypothetical protein
MGNATSLFNLMRNIGGSIGIATTGTMLARHSQATTVTLSANVTAYDAASQTMLAQLQAAFMAAGADATTASSRAYVAPRRDGAPAGDDGVVCRHLRADGDHVRGAGAAGAADEAPVTQCTRWCCTLGN